MEEKPQYMEDKPQSKASQHIEGLMQQLPPDSERYRILASAKQFKSSWLELGEWLARVSGNSHYSEWGYGSFQDYCTKEIRIRRQTAEKLLLAYRFLERKEPELLERQEQRALPDYRSVDLLRKADEESHFSMAEYSELREAVFDQERNHPTVAKQFRDISFSHKPEQQETHRLKSTLTAARRLVNCLHELPEIPAEVKPSIAPLIALLEEKMAEEADVAETSEETPE